MNKPGYFILVLLGLQFNTLQATTASATIASEIDKQTITSSSSLDYFNMAQGKKGTITRKKTTTFVIDSDDGNTYEAPIEPGYDVGDNIWHSEPLGGIVLILDHQS